jgi:hypothetical protein
MIAVQLTPYRQFRTLPAVAAEVALEGSKPRVLPQKIVRRFGEIGIGEFVLFWPPDEHLDLFEHVATEVIPALRTGMLS